MVLVAVDGLGVAAGGVAGRGAGAQEVRELAAGGVPILGLAMVALAPGDGLGSEPQLVEELVQAREPGGVGGLARARPAWVVGGRWRFGGWGWRVPGVLAGGAGVGGGGAVGVDDRGAPAGSGVPGGGLDEVPSLGWVEQADAVGGGGGSGPAEEGADRDEEVDGGRERCASAGAQRAAPGGLVGVGMAGVLSLGGVPAGPPARARVAGASGAVRVVGAGVVRVAGEARVVGVVGVIEAAGSGLPSRPSGPVPAPGPAAEAGAAGRLGLMRSRGSRPWVSSIRTRARIDDSGPPVPRGCGA